MKNKIKEDMKTLFKIFSLVVAMTLMAGTAYGARMYYDSNSNNPSQWSTYATPTQSGADYTATISGLTTGTQYYIALATGDSYNTIYYSQNTECTYVVNSGVQTSESVLQIGSQNYNLDNVRYQFIRLTPSVSTLLVSYNNDNHIYTISSGATTYTISTDLTGCTLDKTSAVVAQGESATFYLTPETGYKYKNATISVGTAGLELQDENKTLIVTPTSDCTLKVEGEHVVFNLTASVQDEHGTVSPTTMSNVEYGTNVEFTVSPASGYYIDADLTTFTGSAKGITKTDSKVTLTYVQSAGELEVYFKNDEKPVIYVGAYPAQGSGTTANKVNLDGYLADRHCNTVTAAGFYWSTSQDIELDDVTTALGGGEGKDNIIPAQAIPTTAGTSFSKSGATLTGITETQNVYFVAYATAGGETNISDIVGLEFRYCNGIESVSLSPASAQLPTGYSTTFTATPRGAGKSPVYTWYDGDNVISGATGSTLEYTMPDAAAHTIKVSVSEESCGSVVEATASVETCAAPSIVISASPSSTTPWQPVTLTATLENADQGAWTSDPEAEIIVRGFAENVDTAIMSAPVQSGDQTIYDVTYTAEGNQCGTTEVVTSATTKVTIVKDQEDCTK